ncbi:hypothetical protein EUGRSUZ_B01826 [Eucalyptus grandis]|uniref:Uncharacterized protein n=2 Tax=Eucalyptus grandis TaxID=71139 RepID=A0ACC3LR66_EUCGR|nr:hypothetical protein EUGRSUZ_B01826 [Eucalyptus grandis]
MQQLNIFTCYKMVGTSTRGILAGLDRTQSKPRKDLSGHFASPARFLPLEMLPCYIFLKSGQWKPICLKILWLDAP